MFHFMNENNYVEISNFFHVREVLSPIVVPETLNPLKDSTGADSRSGKQPRLGNLTNAAMFLNEITPISHMRAAEYRSLSK